MGQNCKEEWIALLQQPDSHCIKHWQLLLPASFCGEILKDVHDQCGHQGAECTEHLVRERCWWPGLHNYIRKYLFCCLSGRFRLLT